MPIALVTHPDCLAHDTGAGHPERPDRLRAVLAALNEDRFPDLLRQEAPRATPEQLEAAHDPAHVSRILSMEVPQGRLVAIDPDTIMSADSIEAALRAAGAAILGVDLVIEGTANAAFAAVRPPGHHAEPDRAMGFCLFNNVAVAVHHARKKWGLERIAVADFDVHHGNGTQAAFWDDPGVFFASSHQSPFYPGTGSAHERGVAGTIANAPLRAGADSDEFRAVWREQLLPALDAFAPQLVLVSAGFDGHVADPLAQTRLETDDYAWITRELVTLARRHAQGRIVSLLEGGYDLNVLAEATAAHVHELAATTR